MDYRKAYLRRSKKWARLEKRLAIGAMLAALAGAAVLLQAQEQDAAPNLPAVAMAASAAVPAAAPAAASVKRPVYPHSIVPGGVGSQAELAHAVAADKVVAAHYAGFAVDKASLRTVAKARAVYVSYRKGGQVYWTSKKVMLAEGETLLSDGENDIRGRCGNRISDTPRLPVEAKGPEEQELDTPVDQAADGAVRQVSYDMDEDGQAMAFELRSFPDGAGLLAITRTLGSLEAGYANPALPSMGSLAEADRRQALLGWATASSSPASRVASSSTITSSATESAGEAAPVAAGGGGKVSSASTVTSGGADGGTEGSTEGGTRGSTGEPGTGGTTSGGDSAGVPVTAVLLASSEGGGASATGNGDKPAAGTQPPTGMRPDGLPAANAPAKSHAVPEPGSLWLTGLAAAALLLQRRRPRRPR